MTADEITVLRLALTDGGRLRYRTVYDAMQGERGYYVLNRLERQGAMEHHAYDDWRITEKGRIAIALASVTPREHPNSVDIGRAERATESHVEQLARGCGTVPATESPEMLKK